MKFIKNCKTKKTTSGLKRKKNYYHIRHYDPNFSWLSSFQNFANGSDCETKYISDKEVRNFLISEAF